MRERAAGDLVRVPLRFRDLDAFGHVYHAEYLTVLDQARTQWFATVGLEHPESYVVVHLEIDWVSSLDARDDAVAVAFAVEKVGTTSITLRESMHGTDGRKVALSRSVTVRWDRLAAATRPLTPPERAALDGSVESA